MKYETQICWVSNLQTFTATIFFTFIVAVLSEQQVLAQISEDFSDHDFINSPSWRGTDSLFIISETQLKLQAPSRDGTAYLSTPCTVIKNASWEFKVTLEFNPSSNNYTRVYIIADQANLSGPLNGYFIMVGDTKKTISLWKQTGTSYTKIITGRDDILNASKVTVKIRVVRDDNDAWQLFSDVGTTGDYITEGATIDSTFNNSNYFGILCKYTSTRSDKFYFDDFQVKGDAAKDLFPPILNAVEVISSQQLRLTFSEALNQTRATASGNYSINQGIGNPQSAKLEADGNDNIVNLIFDKSFPQNEISTLTVSGISDKHDNVMETQSHDFLFYLPAPTHHKDIIITEIFADPSSTVGLPELEFIELYNRSENAFSLANWKFTDLSSTAILPDLILLPKQYVILTSQNSDFTNFGKVLTLSSFPTLNNTSDVLILKDANGITIDSVNYSVEWYKDEDKSKGGWTLELIDPQNICSDQENWTASEHGTGGTPGIQNSVFANKPDITGPKLVAAVPLSSTQIELQFNEKLEKQLPSIANFNIIPSVALIDLTFGNISLTKLNISLEEDLQAGTRYAITVSNIYDCAGNPIQPEFGTIAFGLPEQADSLEILINEILFNPRPTGVDFVEILNNSSKFINLKDWAIANSENGILKNKMIISSSDIVWGPGEYLALTENIDILKGEYTLSDEKNFLKTDKLPPFNDDEGSVVLMDSNGFVIDSLAYNSDMHSVFLKDDEGVSLERISLRQSSPWKQNWKSASSTVGFATPGYLNSGFREELPLTSDVLKVEPEIFNPVGGQPNFTRIHYNFDQGGNIGSVKIFDPQGHLIKQLANNDILGTQGFYRWDGDREDGTKARMGYYMVRFEVFNEQGIVRKYQKRIAIATTF